MSKPKERQDPIAALEEWHDHQYTPGYYVGGKLPPFYWGKRPNYIGCVPLVTGLSMVGIIVFATIMQIAQGASLALDPTSLLVSALSIIVTGGLIAIQILAGIKLLQKPPNKKKSR